MIDENGTELKGAELRISEYETNERRLLDCERRGDNPP
jgi:hypothetical protein